MKTLSLLLFAVLALLVAGCGTQSVTADRELVDRQQQIYQDVQPVPLYDYSQDRATFLQIYNAKNEARQTWAVITAIDGTVLWTCPSYGFPIPATTQVTNPQQYIPSNGAVVEQAEPNGLYTGETNATYVLCIRPNGDVVPIYAEHEVMLFPFEVRIENGKIVDAGGGSTMTVEVKGGTATPASPAP